MGQRDLGGGAAGSGQWGGAIWAGLKLDWVPSSFSLLVLSLFLFRFSVCKNGFEL